MTSAGTSSEHRVGAGAWAAFAVVGVASLGLVSVIDDATWALFMRYIPGLSFVGHYRIASLAACVVLALTLVGVRAFRLPGSDASVTTWPGGLGDKHAGSIWPSTAVHLVCNLFSVVRSELLP